MPFTFQIAITDPNCPRLPNSQAIMIPLIQRGQELSQLLLDAREQKVLKWKACVLLLDKTLLNGNIQLVESLFYHKANVHIDSISLYLNTIDDTLKDQRKRNAIYEILARFSTSNQKNQFLVISKHLKDIIEIADKLKLFDIYNQWLFIVLDTKWKEFSPVYLTQNLRDGGNIAFALNQSLTNCQDTSSSVTTILIKAFSEALLKLEREERALYGEISDEEWQAIKHTKQEQKTIIPQYMKQFLKRKSSSCLRWNIKTAISWSNNKNNKKRRAVVVDHQYLNQLEINNLENIKKAVRDAIGDVTGIDVKYFNWSSVRLKKDFISVVTISNCEKAWNFFQRRQMPFTFQIAITDPNCPRLPNSQAIMIPLIQRGQELSQLLLDAREQKVLKWKACVLLLDKTLLNGNIQLVESLFYHKANVHIDSISLYLNTIDDTLKDQRKRNAIYEILARFSTSNQKNQFLVISKHLKDIIEIADKLKLFDIYNQWLFIVLDTKWKEFSPVYLTQNLRDGGNIAFALNQSLTNCQDTSSSVTTILIKAFSEALLKLEREERALYGEISDEEWQAIKHTKQEQKTIILQYMKQFLKRKSSSCLRWNIKTAISWSNNKNNKKRRENDISWYDFINAGCWTPLVGFNMTDFIFPHIEHKFRNATMNIITHHNPPWQILRYDHNGMIVSSSGIVIDLLKGLSQKLNFTYNLFDAKMLNDLNETKNSSSGSVLYGSMTHIIPNEVVEMLQGNQVFMAAVASTIDDPEIKPFNFTIPISIQKYAFISRKPSEFSRIYLFIAPFTIQTWVSLMGAIFLMAPLLYVINILTPVEELRTPGLCSLKNCFWYMYGALLQQGGMYLPKADSGRVIIGIWWIVVIVLVTTYCGNLVAFLTFPKFQPGIDYLYQSFEHKSITEFGLRNGTYFQKYCSSSNRLDLKMFLRKAIIYSNASSEGIASVERGERINIDWRINLQLAIHKNFEKIKECSLELGKESFIEERIGLIMPKNSPYIKLVNDHIKLLFQTGFIEHWHQKNFVTTNKCETRRRLGQTSNHKVNLDDMQGCFLVLLLGSAIAVLSIFIEYWYQRLHICNDGKIGIQFAC